MPLPHLGKCDERPDCQRTGQAAAPHPAAPLGARPIPRRGRPHRPLARGRGSRPAAAPRTQRGRDVSYVGSGRSVRRDGAPNLGGRGRRADSAGVSIDRFQKEPSGGAGGGRSRWGTGPMWPRGPREDCGPWRGVGPEGPVRGHILRKEVIQPQVPLRLPCYDLVPITGFTFGACR